MLNFQRDYPALVIAGLWNYAIFNEEWVGRNLLPGESLIVEYPLQGGSSLRISTNELRIFAHESRLQFSVLDTSPRTFQKIEGLGKKVAGYLPHTPITAFGFNFNYTSTRAEIGELTRVFDCLDGIFARLGSGSLGTSFKRVHERQGSQMTVEIINSPSKVDVNVNYHYNVPSLADFISIVAERPIQTLKDDSIDVLDSLMNIATFENA